MKVEIIIEQFDNGISLKWNDYEAATDKKCVVALERDQARVIGEMILEDIRKTMDLTTANKVKMEFDYRGIMKEGEK